MVHVNGTSDSSGRAVALSMKQDHDAEGPIVSIDATAQNFVVLDQTVRVEISGLKNASGEIVATRIEKRAASASR